VVYKSNVDILRLLKLKFETILIHNNTTNINTTIEDIQPYGSRVTGTYTDDSDADFHINYSLYFYYYIYVFIILEFL